MQEAIVLSVIAGALFMVIRSARLKMRQKAAVGCGDCTGCSCALKEARLGHIQKGSG